MVSLSEIGKIVIAIVFVGYVAVSSYWTVFCLSGVTFGVACTSSKDILSYAGLSQFWSQFAGQIPKENAAIYAKAKCDGVEKVIWNFPKANNEKPLQKLLNFRVMRLHEGILNYSNFSARYYTDVLEYALAHSESCPSLTDPSIWMTQRPIAKPGDAPFDQDSKSEWMVYVREGEK